jgi:hypothetical protein
LVIFDDSWANVDRLSKRDAATFGTHYRNDRLFPDPFSLLYVLVAQADQEVISREECTAFFLLMTWQKGAIFDPQIVMA